MKIISYNRAKKIVKEASKNNKKVIFRTGCFDILHYGHIAALQRAKTIADILIVGLGTDSTLFLLKGPGHPYFDEKVRAKVLAALECVDYVVLLKEPVNGTIDHEQFLFKVRPHFFYLSANDKSLNIKKQLAKKFGIAVKIQKKDCQIFSSTAIAEKIQAGG